MADQSFFSLFATFSLIELANIGAGIIDGLIVSNFFDPNTLAAVGISSPMFSISGIASGLFATGMQTMCAQELGRGNMKSLNRLFSSVFYIAAAVSAIFMTAELIFAGQLAVFFGASGKGAELAELSSAYIRGLAFGFPAIVLSIIVSAACQLDSARQRAMRATIVYSVSNIAFDMLAVALNAGVFGIGLATSLGAYVQLGYLLLHFRSKDRMLHFVKFRVSLGEMRELMLLGTEKALRRLSNVVAPVLVNKMIIFYGGSVAMTAMAVERNMLDFAGFMAIGIADALSLQVGVFYGEKDDEAIREIGNCAHRFCGRFLCSVTVLFIILSRPLAAIYTSDRGALFDMASYGVIIAGVCTPFFGLVRARVSYLRAVHRTKNMQAMIVLDSLIFPVSAAFILGRLFGAYGVLATNPVSQLMSLTAVWIYYAVKCRKPLPTPDEYMNLPKELHCAPGDVISLDIRDEDDISLVAEQIQLFCRGHKIDKKIGMKAALCFEELAVNIINFGFPKCKKQPAIDLRLVFADGELVMRLRDNCPMFDVERNIAQEISGAEDETELRLGLKMIGGLAENISYVHSLENNNVILRFLYE